MLSKVHTFKLNGIEAVPVTVECDITAGIGIHLVGLADVAVKQSLLRTITAMQSLGYRIPGKKIVINLAPADLCKDGSSYDLPIALAIIAASEQQKLPHLDEYVIAGELRLDGGLREIPGWIQCAKLAQQSKKGCIMPVRNARHAATAFCSTDGIYGVSNLVEAIRILSGQKPKDTAFYDWTGKPHSVWNDIPGQDSAKRALEIAAAGGHPILMVGGPDSGKSRLARALCDILPPMDSSEALDVQRIYSVCNDERIAPYERPFRAPHYSSSMMAMLGGGSGGTIIPGEVSLAHNGVLFLDECNQAPKALLEALRGPLEGDKITITRLKVKADLPTAFFPVFATEPCPCGHYGEGDRCTCTPAQRERWLSRLSGPVYDHLTMQVLCQPATPNDKPGEPSHIVAERVRKARERQIERQGKLNDELNATEAEEACGISGEYGGEDIFNAVKELISKLNLSCRAYSRTLKIARTIADLDGREQLTTSDVAEAASYRFLDRRTL